RDDSARASGRVRPPARVRRPLPGSRSRPPRAGASLGDRLPRVERCRTDRLRAAPGLVFAPPESFVAAGDLAAWTRDRGAGQPALLGRATGIRTFRRRQPGGPGPRPDPLLLGLEAADRRPRADAGRADAEAPMGAHRPAPRLRGRQQHGWAGNAAPRRALSAVAR